MGAIRPGPRHLSLTLLVLTVLLVLASGCTETENPTDPGEPVIPTLSPYLQLAGPGPDPVVIWATKQPVTSAVYYGLDGDLTHVVEDTVPKQRHVIALPQLAPDSEYSWQAVVPEEISAVGTIRTLPSRQVGGTSDAFTFVAYGDSRSHPSVHAAVIQSVLVGSVPSLVINTGDLVYSGQDELAWPREFFEPAMPLINRSPVMITLGNHDLNSEVPPPYPLATWWLEFFAFPGHETDPGYARWFSYDAGGIHIIHLDSNIASDAVQLAWLSDNLSSPAATEADFRVAVFHHPPYSAGGHDSNLNVREVWEPLFLAHGVDLVFNGHNHFYQRTWSVADGEVQAHAAAIRNGHDVMHSGTGVVYIITGGGGAPLYASGAADFIAFGISRHHHVRVAYTPGSIHCQAVARDGEVLDEFFLEHPE